MSPSMLLQGLNVRPTLSSMRLRPASLDRLTIAPTPSVPEVKAQGFPSPMAVKISRSPVPHFAISLRVNGAKYAPVWRLVVQAPIQNGQNISSLPVARRRFRWDGQKQRTGRSLPQHQTKGRIALEAVNQGRVHARRPYLYQQAINRVKGLCLCLRALHSSRCLFSPGRHVRRIRQQEFLVSTGKALGHSPIAGGRYKRPRRIFTQALRLQCSRCLQVNWSVLCVSPGLDQDQFIAQRRLKPHPHIHALIGRAGADLFFPTPRSKHTACQFFEIPVRKPVKIFRMVRKVSVDVPRHICRIRFDQAASPLPLGPVIELLLQR